MESIYIEYLVKRLTRKLKIKKGSCFFILHLRKSSKIFIIHFSFLVLNQLENRKAFSSVKPLSQKYKCDDRAVGGVLRFLLPSEIAIALIFPLLSKNATEVDVTHWFTKVYRSCSTRPESNYRPHLKRLSI